MNLQDTAYILRYLFIILICSSAIQLIRLAIKEFKWGLNHALRPARGYFLIAYQESREKSDIRDRMTKAMDKDSYLINLNTDQMDKINRANEHELRLRSDISQYELSRGEHKTRTRMQTLALYPTTIIGRSRNCDIQIKSKKILKRHCTVYRYDGDWCIRPQSSFAKVKINGVEIDGETELRNKDQIDIAGIRFDFIDERSSAKQAGMDYSAAKIDDRYFKEAVKLSSKRPRLSFLFFNSFALITIALLTYFIPEDFGKHRMIVGLVLISTIVISDLYYIALNKILYYGDRILLLSVSYLSTIGLLIQCRFSFFRNPWFIGQKELGDSEALKDAVRIMVTRFYVQAGAVILGLVLILFLSIIVKKTRFLESLTIVCFIVTPLFLIATKVLGRGMEENGADLWINIGPISLQLTEFAKISYAIVLASFFKNRPRLKMQIFFALWAAMVFFLIMLLPDLGSAMILLPTTVIVFVIMTSEYFKGLLIVLASSLASVLAYALFPHVQARIAGWTSLWVEINPRNAQIIYGLQAVARGGLLGRGLTNGNPWGIPLFNSDMVFSILCEEFGLLVGLAIVVFYTIIWLRTGRGAALARDGFSATLILALGTMLFVEATVVIGGTTGLLPLTGATLPFIARGGSSILAKWIMIAMLLGLLGRQEAGANRL